MRDWSSLRSRRSRARKSVCTVLSRNGQWVGFFAGGKLKNFAGGGQPVALCDAPAGRGASCGEKGTIVAALDIRVDCPSCQKMGVLYLRSPRWARRTQPSLAADAAGR